jgi:hypothetical protein
LDWIGLRETEGARWDRFVRLAPNRALPRFVGSGIEASTVDRYVRAHHIAAFFWVVADRIADGQCPRTRELTALRKNLLCAWAGALSDALGDRDRARNAIARDLRAWRRGLTSDRVAFRQGDLEPAEYFNSVRQRLRCVSTCARAMLEDQNQTREAAVLVRASDWFLFACQCRDDAVDADEDRSLRGASVPDLLGLSPGALVSASARLIAVASEAAKRGGLEVYAAWLRGFARDSDVALQGEPATAQAFGAFALLQGLRDLERE